MTSAAGAPRASTIELAFAGLLLPGAVFIGAQLTGCRGLGLAWPLAYPIVYLASNALTCNAIGHPKLHGLLPLAAPVMAASTMWFCIWVISWQLSGSAPVGLSLVIQIIVGAISYLAAFHLLAPALARDAIADHGPPASGTNGSSLSMMAIQAKFDANARR